MRQLEALKITDHTEPPQTAQAPSCLATIADVSMSGSCTTTTTTTTRVKIKACVLERWPAHLECLPAGSGLPEFREFGHGAKMVQEEHFVLRAVDEPLLIVLGLEFHGIIWRARHKRSETPSQPHA